MMKLLVALLILGGIFFYTGGPTVEETNEARALYTPIEKNIEQMESSLGEAERIKRLFMFKEAVEAAITKRVKKEDYIESRRLPNDLKKALVATEDKRYYDHGALDIYGISRALYTNMVAGKTVEGGSTITQQVVKNLFLSANRTWARKGEEMVLAILMEENYSKDEILAIYLNTVYFGNNYYGIKAASEGYFNRKPQELSLAQSALLAGLPQAPSYYNPVDNYEEAKKRQYTVLSLMVAQGLITQKEAEAAYMEDLGL